MQSCTNGRDLCTTWDARDGNKLPESYGGQMDSLDLRESNCRKKSDVCVAGVKPRVLYDDRLT